LSISYSATPTALRVEIKPSNYFRIALIGVALAVLAAIFYAALEWPLRLLLVLLVLIYSGCCWRTQRRQRGVLQWRSVWFWRGVDGIERAMRLSHSTVWPRLIVLTFREIKRGQHEQNFVLTLFADSLDMECARRLRVYLNHFPVFDALEPTE
jgi:hypothetical protein